MAEPEYRTMDARKIFAGYSTVSEYLDDALAILDHRLYLYYKYHQWVGPQNNLKNMLGLVVSRQEFEHNVDSASRGSLFDKLDDDEKKQLDMDCRIFRARVSRSDRWGNPILQIFDRFNMDQFERDCFILALAPYIDDKYEKLFAYLQDDIAKKAPTRTLAVNLFMDPEEDAWKYEFRFSDASGLVKMMDPEALAAGKLVLEKEVLSFLNGRIELSPEFDLFDGTDEQTKNGRTELVIDQDYANKIDHTLSLNNSMVQLFGIPGAGRHFQVESACIRNQKRCIFAELDTVENKAEMIRKAGMLAILTESMLCINGIDAFNAEEDWIGPTRAVENVIVDQLRNGIAVFVISQKPIHLQTQSPVLELHLDTPDVADRLVLFTHFFADVPVEEGLSLEELASKFHFTPKQIALSAEQAKGYAEIESRRLTVQEVHNCCYNQAVHKLDKLASRIKPAFTWEELILPEDMKRTLKQACAHVRFGHRVYDDWGFGKRIPYGRGLSILFDGPPGTGKTMCARIMAKELNMEMYKINISQIVSKYIGETEKNLQAVFKEAKNADCILFFDECDSLFGKRSEVKDSHDRNANVETAYLLQQIEEYDGVCILATNLLKNIDEAFLRRITYVVHFPFPDEKMREDIYHSTVTRELPIDSDIDWQFMAEKFPLSGGYIKNIVLAAAFRAAQENIPMNMRHLLNCAINEMRKNEIVVVRENLREYEDLLE